MFLRRRTERLWFTLQGLQTESPPLARVVRPKNTNFHEAPLLRSPAFRAISADLQPRNQHPEPAVFFNPLFQFFEFVAHELGDLSTAQTRHMDVIASQPALVIMTFAVDVHQIELVNHPMPLEQPQSPVHRAAVYAGIDLLRLAQNLARIQMFAGRLHHAENRAPLLRHTNSALSKLSL